MLNFDGIRPEPPKPPPPPEKRLQCGCCGYTDVKSQYKHTCYAGISIGVLLAMMPICLIVIAVVKILNAD